MYTFYTDSAAPSSQSNLNSDIFHWAFQGSKEGVGNEKMQCKAVVVMMAMWHQPGWCVLQENVYWANACSIMTSFFVNWLKQQVKLYKKLYRP